MSDYMIGIEHGDAHPVLDRFIHIALVEEEFRGFGGGIDRFLEVSCSFEQLPKLFHGRRVLRGHLCSALVNLQGFLKVCLLE